MAIRSLFSGLGSRSDYEKELVETERKVAECLRKGDNECASIRYQLLAKFAEEREDYPAAIEAYKKALRYAEANGKPFNVGWIYRLTSNILFKEKKYSETIEYSTKAVDFFIKAGSIYAAQWSYNLAAKSAEAQGDVYTAIRFYKKSYTLSSDDGIKEELNRLKKLAPYPLVLELVNKKQVKEGEEVEFRIIIENNSPEPLKKVKLIGKYDNVIQEINDLGPHEEKYFSYKTTGKVGILKPGYKKIFWENAIGDSFEEPIEAAEVRVSPDVEVMTSINPAPRLNKPSNFIILVKNKSSSRIRNVEISADFPDTLKIPSKTQTFFDKIEPQSERGSVFSVIPLSISESTIKNIHVKYRDELGEFHTDKINSFIIEEAIREPEMRKSYGDIQKELGQTGIQYLKTIESKRRELQVSPHPISIEEFIRMTTALQTAERGYTLGNVHSDHISAHIIDACSQMALISHNKMDGEQLFLFSGIEMGTIYLLTAAIKEEEKFVNVLFKAYSNKPEKMGKFLNNCADIVEYTTMVMSSAKEVEKIEVNQVIKIIDSIVQRSQIGSPSAKNKDLIIKDSVVQRSGEK